MTREAILEATARLLVEDGYARTSTNRIAERAGVSVGSLYHYFGDKQAIVEALTERVMERQLAELATTFATHAELGFEAGVRSLVTAALASQRVEAPLAHVLLTQCPRSAEADLDRRWKQGITELLAAQLLSAREPVRPRNVELAAYVLVHALFGVVRDAIAERPRLLEGDALTIELTELTLRYLHPDG